MTTFVVAVNMANMLYPGQSLIDRDWGNVFNMLHRYMTVSTIRIRRVQMPMLPVVERFQNMVESHIQSGVPTMTDLINYASSELNIR